MNIQEIIKKSQSGGILNHEELIFLLELPPWSMESHIAMAEAARVSKELTEGMAEVHAQFAVNLGPCPCDCLFCSFAKCNGIFSKTTILSPEDIVSYAMQFENDGANSIYMMSTAVHSFERFLEIAKEARQNLKPDTVMIANVGDQSYENAVKLKDSGFKGVYHAVRLREGIDTGLSVEQRLKSINNFREAGLSIGTCVEPVGPEHTNEELALMVKLTASFEPAFSGAARRISIPGTAIAERGMISEIRMAQIVAVTRLGMPRNVLGNCTHEPCTLGAAGGANLFWAEVGANPRDTQEKTEEGRGETVESCGSIFTESGWNVWPGPSRYF